MLNTTNSGPLRTGTPIELEHFKDTTPGDPYECVTLNIDGVATDLPLEDAERLGAELLMFVGKSMATM